VLVLGVWHLATLQPAPAPAPAVALTPEQIEYAKLMGKDPADAAANAATGTSGKSGFPTLAQMGAAVVRNLSQPVLRQRPQRQGPGPAAGPFAGPRGAGLTCWRRWWPFRWAS
jgi:nitrate/nitrite transport system permease protein